MVLFNWTEKFELGIKEIDQQHKQIVDLINNLNDLKNKEADNEVLGKIINGLICYTKTHLLYEEKLLKQHEYPEFASHKSEHDQLVKKVIDLQMKFNTGHTGLSTDIAILLNDWLAEHILVVDKKYVPYLKDKVTALMAKIEYMEKLLIGIEEIDKQHMKICDIFNSLVKAKEKKNEDEAMEIVMKLLESWKMHFNDEEGLMKQHKYSDLDAHKKNHDRIINDFSTCGEMYSEGFKFAASCLAMNLNLWIEEHVRHVEGDDKRLAKYLKSKGVT